MVKNDNYYNYYNNYNFIEVKIHVKFQVHVHHSCSKVEEQSVKGFTITIFANI